MTDSNFNPEPLLFKELPKEQQKELRKEFDKTSKTNKTLIVVTIVMAIVLIASAVLGLFTDHRLFGGTIFPAWIIPIFIVLNEDKFAKWLEAEKNITMKRKKQKP